VNKWNEYARRIEDKIMPNSNILAIKMLESEGDIPEGSVRPKRDFGSCLSTCQCFALSRRERVTIAQLMEDMWCPEPVIGFGIAETPQYFLDGNNRLQNVESLEAGANWAREFPRFEAGKYVGVVSAPMKTCNFEPDLAVIYCNSAQLLRLLLGTAYKDGRDITTTLGGHAACVYTVVPAMKKKECQATVPCRGDRGFAGAQDDEMIFTVPKEKIEDLAFGIEQKGTGAIPTTYSMTPEYRLSVPYAKMARMMGMKTSDGTQIKGYTGKERKYWIQYR
jgi:uncharacterized protein (DUF169 family)